MVLGLLHPRLQDLRTMQDDKLIAWSSLALGRIGRVGDITSSSQTGLRVDFPLLPSIHSAIYTSNNGQQVIAANAYGTRILAYSTQVTIPPTRPSIHPSIVKHTLVQLCSKQEYQQRQSKISPPVWATIRQEAWLIICSFDSD